MSNHPASTPCGPVPDTCDAEAGEPCPDHERQQAHAEGEHAFCGPDCTPVTGMPTAARATPDDVARCVTRAIFALKVSAPAGSKHYRSGWDDGVEAAMDAARDMVLAALSGESGPSAVLERVAKWVSGDVVTAASEFGNGYREAQRDIRDVIKGRRLADEAQQPGKQRCTCGGWFPISHIHADTHSPVAADEAAATIQAEGAQ